MDKTIKIINELKRKGLIKDYAIGGGIATIYYKDIEKIRKILEQAEVNKERLKDILHKYDISEKFKLL